MLVLCDEAFLVEVEPPIKAMGFILDGIAPDARTMRFAALVCRLVEVVLQGRTLTADRG